ncbi:hypothetical protein CEN40_02025 [Fischerella thermalis CCMEE 5205]|nr:hypothetical protein CEN40_02025 [Fischerella thermalis CCMEE 5205]
MNLHSGNNKLDQAKLQFYSSIFKMNSYIAKHEFYKINLEPCNSKLSMNFYLKKNGLNTIFVL